MICTKAVQVSTASARLFSCKSTASRAKFSASIRSRRVMSTVSASREVVSTENAPGAVGPYSQAIKAGGFVYISGQVPLVPGTKDFAADDVTGQTEQVMKNLDAILTAAGSDWSKVVKTTVLLADMGDFAAMNAVYAKYFTKDPPARAAFAVKDLPLGAKVEIEAVALQ